MKKYLPNYVFKKKYDSFYIFSDSEIILNDTFSEKLELFLNENNSDELIFEVETPSRQAESDSNNIVTIKNPNRIKINEFYEKEFEIDGNKLVLCLFNYLMYDNSNLWGGYVSSDNGVCIIGCDDKISSLFEVVFNPYSKENLEQKYKMIDDVFDDEKSKLDFIESLEKNYKFSKNSN